METLQLNLINYFVLQMKYVCMKVFYNAYVEPWLCLSIIANLKAFSELAFQKASCYTFSLRESSEIMLADEKGYGSLDLKVNGNNKRAHVSNMC